MAGLFNWEAFKQGGGHRYYEKFSGGENAADTGRILQGGPYHHRAHYEL